MNAILIASQNPHKIEKLSSFLHPLFSKIETLKDVLIKDESAEEGQSFKEIAENKALYFSKLYAEYTISTDGGMVLPGLESWNPLYTTRFISNLDKTDTTDFQRMDELLAKTAHLSGADRNMQWREAVAIAKNGRLLFSIEVDGAAGRLQESYDVSKYKPGIWLCSLWSHPQFENKNFFDLTEEERNRSEISWIRIADAIHEYFNNINQP
jgi:inosine/xanthosine triphosphate pyrophosphatase family protein